jgi:ribonuclease P protein component
MRYRFPKSARLTSVGEFQKVKNEGVSCHGRFMVLSVLKNSPSAETRVGLITSKRIGNAVERNRVRRRFRELVRKSRPALEQGLWMVLIARLEQGLWMVLIARRDAAKAAFQSVEREWLQLAKRASILAGHP